MPTFKMHTDAVIHVEQINYRVVQKTAQSLWHHNFATVHHSVMQFSAKCFEKNSLHD